MQDLSHVMRIDFTRDYGNLSEYLLALFNKDRISEEEVLQFIREDGHYHPDIIIISPRQFDSVFNKIK